MSAIRLVGCALAVSLLVVGCTDQPLSPEHAAPDGSAQVDKPLFNHGFPPPYAHAIQNTVGLPVFDFYTLVNWVQNSVVRKPFAGFL